MQDLVQWTLDSNLDVKKYPTLNRTDKKQIFFFLYSIFQQMGIYAVNGLEICLYKPKKKNQVLPGHLIAVCQVQS